LWEEKAQHLTTYSNFWKQFYRKFPQYREASVTAREFEPGERVEVDYAGEPIEWIEIRCVIHAMSVHGFTASRSKISGDVGQGFHDMSVQHFTACRSRWVRRDNHGYRGLFSEEKEIVGGPSEVVHAQDSRGFKASG